MTDFSSKANLEKSIQFYTASIIDTEELIMSCIQEQSKITAIYIQDNNIKLERKLDRIYKNNQHCLQFFKEYIKHSTAKVIDLHKMLDKYQ